MTRTIERTTSRVIETVEIDGSGIVGAAHEIRPSSVAREIAYRSVRERLFALFAALLNRWFVVLIAVWIPVVAQIVVYHARGLSFDPVWLSVELYSIACLTAITLFGELLWENKGKRVSPALHAYHVLLYWSAPITLLACVLAIVVLGVGPHTAIGSILAARPLIAVLVAALLYLSYEIPTLWAATAEFDHPKSDIRSHAYSGHIQH
jgi:hypothetical protein